MLPKTAAEHFTPTDLCLRQLRGSCDQAGIPAVERKDSRQHLRETQELKVADIVSLRYGAALEHLR